jgi:hypothetical protein
MPVNGGAVLAILAGGGDRIERQVTDRLGRRNRAAIASARNARFALALLAMI